MIELVIFDMDGLMFDTERICLAAWSQALVDLGFTPDKDLYISTVGMVGSQVYTDYYGKSLDREKLSQLMRSYMAETIAQEGLTPKPGLVELMAFLDLKGIKKAIASSSPRAEIMRNLSVSGIGNGFDYIISGREVERGKPYPDIFLNVCHTLHIPVEKALVLEDSLNGIRAAHAGGIKCILVPDMVPVTEEMENKAEKVVESLHFVIDYLKVQNNL